MRLCSKCSLSKPETEYYTLKSLVCKDCTKERQRRYHQRTRDKRLEAQKKYYSNNKDYFSAKNKKYRDENGESLREYNRQYSKEHYQKNKDYYIRKSRVRDGIKREATPDWLSDPHRAHIRRTYKLRDIISDATGIEYHVDHIVPLRGKNVCGLHVPWNLRVITAEENLSKSNQLE